MAANRMSSKARASLAALTVKNLSSRQETQVQSLDREDSPGERITYPLWYSCLENPTGREPGGLQSVGSQRVGDDLVTNFHFLFNPAPQEGQTKLGSRVRMYSVPTTLGFDNLLSVFMCLALEGFSLWQTIGLPLFHTVHGVLKARIWKWFAIPFSSGPHSVRTLHHDLSALGGPTRHGSIELDKAVVHEIRLVSFL